MFVDYHVHSEFSDDSIYPMEDVIKDAIKLGINELCFTDHVDYGIKLDWDDPRGITYRNGEPLANVDYPRYMAKIQALQEKYKDKIIIKMGMEFGMQMHTIHRYETLFKKYPFDFIILSVHEIENHEFWTGEFQQGRSQKQYNERYYEEILNIIKEYKNYSVLGHLDLIVRYDEQGVYPFGNVKDIIAEILKQVIKDNKGIELNTSYHRYGLRDTTPSRDILKLYHDLGGKIITIGSDSHKKEHLGAYYEEGIEILKEIGFDSICTFDKMQPTFHKI